MIMTFLFHELKDNNNNSNNKNEYGGDAINQSL